MKDFERAKSLIIDKEYRKAGNILDKLLAKKKDNPELWYTRGVLSLKLKNYDKAHECFEHAIMLERKAKYYKTKGMAHLELFEVDEALDSFENALMYEKKDPAIHFFLSVCYMLFNDPRGKEYMEKAYVIDSKKTKQMLKNFYQAFFAKDPKISKNVKDELKKRIEEIK